MIKEDKMAQNECPHASVEGRVIICDQTGESCVFDHPNSNCLLAEDVLTKIMKRKEKFS